MPEIAHTGHVWAPSAAHLAPGNGKRLDLNLPLEHNGLAASEAQMFQGNVGARRIHHISLLLAQRFIKLHGHWGSLYSYSPPKTLSFLAHLLVCLLRSSPGSSSLFLHSCFQIRQEFFISVFTLPGYVSSLWRESRIPGILQMWTQE